MDDLLIIINNIVKYGLNPVIPIEDRELDLEKYLVRLYAKYVEVSILPDTADEYVQCNIKQLYPDVIQHVQSNFEFGWYYTVLNMEEL